MQGCNSCVFFYITWDTKCPYGCKAMGFKSKNSPREIVKIHSYGRECLAYRSKKENNNSESSIINNSIGFNNWKG